ncbi:hypothetical protein [Luteimonas saliphila]|uniref:hypothetical protein n=1 Tax=Luteimonas saliphila TaxID=2804919 RepID=UPI00192DA9A1|nr:hypothetical protein [Luteimonas saliphila]
MSFIDETWLRKAHRALKETLDVDQATKRDMIQFLFDEGFWDPGTLSWDSAVARFNDNCNPTKQQFWKIGEVWALMVRFQRHDLLAGMAESMGFELRPIPTEERRQALLLANLQRLDSLTEELADTRAQIERLATLPPDRTIPALPGHKPHFSMGTEPTDKARTAVERIGPL